MYIYFSASSTADLSISGKSLFLGLRVSNRLKCWETEVGEKLKWKGGKGWLPGKVVLFFKSAPKDVFIAFRERGREGEKQTSV